MEMRLLHENWRMRRVCAETAAEKTCFAEGKTCAADRNEALGGWQEAVVPGTVYADLLRNGQMENPYWKDNEDKCCALMEDDYEYECRFTADAGFCTDRKPGDCTILRFEGIDSVASVYLNGTYLGGTINMHRVWEFEVGTLLRSEEENVLRIVLHSPLKYIAQAHEKYGNCGNEDTYEGFMHLRKAHYMFGWDWGAHLPDSGIFRAVKLCRITGGRIDSVYVTQEHEEGRCTLTFAAEVQSAADIVSAAGETTAAQPGSFCLHARVTSPDGEVWEAELDEDGKGSLVIEQPQLWWVNGLGEQPLYEVEVTMSGGGWKKAETKQDGGTRSAAVYDTWKRRIGLRTITMQREKDAWGESFAHVINGQPFFAMGANYIPEDHVLGWRSPERTRRLLEDCKRANFNVVRVWGGGFYPDDWFYDICDELGLAVWQDFMFACSVYELTPEFEANIRREFADNIKRLRHHASLALWCGNNEMESFVVQRCWVTKQSEVRDYLFMYERIIPEELRAHDPQRYYWPASPSSGGSFDEPDDPNRGDVHYWKVWHGNRPFSAYRKFCFRYLSEFGFQSLPCKSTIEQISDDPADWNMFSYVMEKHQRNYGANGKIMNYMQQTYRYPVSFETLIYASQLLQADAIRYGVEHFRRNRGRCMGTIYWQLNDCWPVISWSSIDYCERWKALHYYAARFFAPLMISCEEESWLTQEANMNRQHFEFEKSIRLNVTNETLRARNIEVCWYLRNAKGEALREERTEVTVPPMQSVWLDKVLLPEINVFEEYVSFEAWEQGSCVSEGTVIFSYPKYFRYEDPHLTCEVNGRFLTVRADAYAKSVEIANETEDLRLSDNYFDLNSGEKTVEILGGEPKNLRLRSVYDIGRA